MAYITKGDLWDLLDDEALTFAGWLLTGSPEASTMKLMLENTEGLTLDTSLIQNQLLPMLVSAGVLTQAVVDRVNAEIASQGATIVSYRKKYRVSEFPPEITDKLNWLASFATKDISVGFYEGIAYIEAEPNTFDCPYATEVI